MSNSFPMIGEDVYSSPRVLNDTVDVIVCGSGSSGSVVARRLSDNPDISVLLLEAGGTDNVGTVTDAARWPENLGSPTDWGFASEPIAHLGDRRIPMSMGKVLGGGSSVNAMIWSRGHRNDWEHFADVSGDPSWGYESVLGIYRRIEDYKGRPDPEHRGLGGLVTVEQSSDPHPIAKALVKAAGSVGVPSFDSPNGAMMEAEQGCAIADVRAQNGRRLSIFGSYIRPVLDRQNLTVATGATVHRIVFDGQRAVAVEVVVGGSLVRLSATKQIVLSLGAINTPRVLMQSGIGDEAELRRIGVPVVQHLAGVGRNLQDHTCFTSVWEYREALAPQANGSEATLFGKSSAEAAAPDILMCQAEFPFCSPEAMSYGLPQQGWTLVAGLSQPKSRGRVRLKTANPSDPVIVDLNALSHPDDWRVARAAVRMAQALGASAAFNSLSAREALPGGEGSADIDEFIRKSAMPFWHQTGTAKMGRDDLSVVDNTLKVYGVSNLTIADGSIMPRITSGNTMAPCVIIGERAGEILHKQIAKA